jgi:acetyltransferase-like isoleucine patch superfamily enzyme
MSTETSQQPKIELDTLQHYTDKFGNRIEYDGEKIPIKRILFNGINNILKVAKNANITFLHLSFSCSNGYVNIGNYGDVKARITLGENCKVIIGDYCYFTERASMGLAEGTLVQLGKGCMIAQDVIFRTHDAHPIFYVSSEKRANPSRDIIIGNHVWIGDRAVIAKGARIHDGSIIGFGSFVTKEIPNNCIAAGVPAKVLKKDVAWEAPGLNSTPYFRPDASCLKKKSKYWNITVEEDTATPESDSAEDETA